MTEHDPLYSAILAYEDAANDVGTLTITTSGAYRGLTDAIGGHGDLEDARYRFAMEASLLASAHEQWKQAVAALNAQVADGAAWQAWTVQRRERCVNCGNRERYTDRLSGGWCSDCRSDRHPDNVEFDEQVQARERADDDAAARATYYAGGR